MNIYEQIGHNKFLTFVFAGIFIIFFLFIGLGFDHFYGAGTRLPLFTAVALLVALGLSWAGYYHGDKMVISSTGAKDLELIYVKQQEWRNVIEEMSIAAGIPVPKTYIIDDADPNAFATGRDPQHSSIVVTRGLLEQLNREELQGVAGHEMSHIKNFDIRLMMIIAVLVGAIALLSDWARRSRFRSRRSRNAGSEGGATLIILVVWLITIMLAPLLSRLVAMCVSRRREYLADASAAELTRNPLGLAAALEKISNAVAPTQSINEGSAHLCICDPKGQALGFKEGWAADLFSTHPPVQKRIEVLKQMAYLYKKK